MSKPVMTYRIGLISASVFQNEVESGDTRTTGKKLLCSVQLTRRYRDKDGEWRSSSSLGLADLPSALEVLRMALDFVKSHEAVQGPP